MPQPLCTPRSTHTPPITLAGSVLNTNSCGGHSTGETPSTIPNLEAKPGSANGTATDRLWESRTPPQHNKTRGTAPPHGVPSLTIPTPPTTSTPPPHGVPSLSTSTTTSTPPPALPAALPAAPVAVSVAALPAAPRATAHDPRPASYPRMSHAIPPTPRRTTQPYRRNRNANTHH